MKQSLLLVFSIFISIQHSAGQDYIPFPTEYAKWNVLSHNTNGTAESITNYSYTLEGDTILNNKNYKKIYLQEENTAPFYFGGLREDSLKNIYFFPRNVEDQFAIQFPSNTTEHLLYTFDSLYVGMDLSINSTFSTFSVGGIDTIIIGNSFHKRYQIDGFSIDGNYLVGGDYWIEGIGSDKGLFYPFGREFEWAFRTTCFSDTLTTYHIANSIPAGWVVGQDSCQFEIPVNIKDIRTNSISIFPNPVKNELLIKGKSTLKNTSISIVNLQGQQIFTTRIDQEELRIDVSFLKKGIYFLQVIGDYKLEVKKFIKE